MESLARGLTAPRVPTGDGDVPRPRGPHFEATDCAEGDDEVVAEAIAGYGDPASAADLPAVAGTSPTRP